jgi:glycosyltransferase involved in cell wall biosynthesis
MAIGLPVVTSNFKLYKDIIEKYNCGICIDPLNPYDVAKAIEFIFKNPEKAKEMGKNGKNIIVKKYNWDIENKKLQKIYQEIIE